MERTSGRAFRKLNAKSAEETSEIGLYSDGLNLYLSVTKSGKYWVFIYNFNTRRRELSLGPTHTITLGKAREMATKLRVKLCEGIDPLQERQDVKAAARQHFTFGEVAEACIRSKERGWARLKSGKIWRAAVANHCEPILNLPIEQVNKGDVRAIVDPLWTTKPGIAGTVMRAVRLVLDYAKAHDLRTGDNPAEWRGHLKEVLSTQKPHKHLEAMPYADVPAFVASFQGEQSIITPLLEFLILTAARHAEARGARWDEFDLDKATWTIPGSRMKAGKEHAVPLSSRAMEILRTRAAVRTGPYVFGKGGNNPPSKDGLWGYFRGIRQGGATIHGFRSSFRDWASEVAHCPREIAEDCLAHSRVDTEAAYHRSQTIERRRPFMQAWADYVAGKSGDNVVAIQRAAS